jgi:hypothetical protein
MKILPIALVGAAALLAGIARAEAPKDAQRLGIAQAIVDFCSRVDPEHKHRFEQQVRKVLGRVSEDRFEDARHTSVYQQAYSLIGSLLSEYSSSDALQACKDIL